MDTEHVGMGKVCTRCGEFRCWSEYPSHKLTLDGKQSWCRGCKTQGMRDMRVEETNDGGS